MRPFTTFSVLHLLHLSVELRCKYRAQQSLVIQPIASTKRRQDTPPSCTTAHSHTHSHNLWGAAGGSGEGEDDGRGEQAYARKLHAFLAPRMLRRLKHNVASLSKELPPKV